MKKFIVFVVVLMLSVCISQAADQSTAKGRTRPGSIGRKPEPPHLSIITSVSTPTGNRTLYENEYGVLDIAVINTGELPATGVVAKVFAGWIDGLTVDSIKVIGHVPAGDTVHTGFLLSTSGRPARQSIFIPITVSDSSGGSVATWQPLSLDLTALPIETFPKVELSDLLTRGRNWVLVIGINEYKYWPNLENAVGDASSVKQVLEEQYGVRPEQVMELYDGHATRANIIRKLEDLARVVKGDDNLLIYYAGHGTYDNLLNRGYWVPTDADIGSSAQYLPNTDLQTFVGAIQSRATLVISDACFSGTVFREEPTRFPLYQNERYIGQVSKLKARQAIISGGNEPVMDSGISGKHSIFAHYLVDRLKQNQDRYLTVSSLFERIKVPITNSSQQTPQCRPIHNTGDEGGEFVFVKRK